MAEKILLVLLVLLPTAFSRWTEDAWDFPKGALLTTGGLLLAGWGLAWFLAASATLAPIYPIWAPNRSGYGSLGLGAALAGLAGAAHPLLLGALVARTLPAKATNSPVLTRSAPSFTMPFDTRLWACRSSGRNSNQAA